MIPPISPLSPITASTIASPVSAPAGTGFASELGNAIDSLQHVQSAASSKEAAAAAGHGSLTNTMITATEATLETQVATSLIDKALAAYTSVSNMTL